MPTTSIHRLLRWVIAAGCSLMITAAGSASRADEAPPPTQAPTAQQAPEQPQAPRAREAPRLIEEPVTKMLSVVAPERGANHGGLGDIFIAQLGPGDVKKLEQWAEQRGKRLGVYFDGRLLHGISVTPISTAKEDSLRFELQRTEENRAALDPLLGGRAFAPRTVAVQIGLEDGTAISTYAPLRLITMPHKSGILILGMSGVLILSLLYLSAKTSILRDGVLPDQKTLGTFSLARVQSLFWFANVAVAFLWIWCITGAADTITESTLVLIGLGGGTALGAKLIDQGGGEAAQKKVAPSQGIFDDLLTDENGYSLPRLQMAVWTVILGVVFWSSVFRKLSMPQFDTTLLGLMGISSGTYLGFKLPERKALDQAKEPAPVAPVAPAAPAAPPATEAPAPKAPEEEKS